MFWAFGFAFVLLWVSFTMQEPAESHPSFSWVNSLGGIAFRARMRQLPSCRGRRSGAGLKMGFLGYHETEFADRFPQLLHYFFIVAHALVPQDIFEVPPHCHIFGVSSCRKSLALNNLLDSQSNKDTSLDFDVR